MARAADFMEIGVKQLFQALAGAGGAGVVQFGFQKAEFVGEGWHEYVEWVKVFVLTRILSSDDDCGAGLIMVCRGPSRG